MEPSVEWIEETSLLAALVLRGFMELASQESGELQRWIRNVGQVPLSICQEKFSLEICGLGK